ncbi:MAG: DUF262 domain-containing HNH endonuclease family protein [Moraxellaceae bacterium]|nr:DUF262 domain-containing HNH endonuclease family protein [Moraxellaceae bacterium]
MSLHDAIRSLSVRELLVAGDVYRVPMYQRNYAWEEGEITQLIVDVLDYLDGEQGYYLGTLVVDRKEANRFEVIDGQQRLTTLTLLVAYLRKRLGAGHVLLSSVRQASLDFECRPASREALLAIFSCKDNGVLQQSEADGSSAVNKGAGNAIAAGYRIIERVLSQKLREHNVTDEKFAAFLLENVHILRVGVPRKTDLNHYFEVMNSRGEQLEKHEVLKATLLHKLQQIENAAERARSENALHRVWEACANMEKYVQSGFTPRERNELFGKNWSDWHVDNFDHLARMLERPRDMAVEELTLSMLLRQPTGPSRSDFQGVDEPERFHAVINFPNFLLQVLRVMTQADVPLDDKRLLDSFDEFLLNTSGKQASSSRVVLGRIKQFVFTLLRCKFLLDRYVIKREFAAGEDNWSLKNYRKDKEGKSYYVNSFDDRGDQKNINRQLLLLLSAFHVSTPTLAYKHWLNAVVFWLFERQRISGADYLKYLESLAAAFVFDRYLSDEGKDYFEIIYVNGGRCRATRDSVSHTMEERLSYGAIENNLVFNYLDYLLWKKLRSKDSRVDRFRFTFRSSVEHYFPQSPKFDDPWIDEEVLNCFGNLCLISHSKNSQLSNYSPLAKKEHYRKGEIDSIKQHLMMDSDPWDTAAATRHHQAMVAVLLSALD